MKFIFFIFTILVIFITTIHCQSWNDTESSENITDIIPVKPFVYYGRYHPRRFHRQISSKDPIPDLDTASTILSILPLDRLGAILGQIMATGLKEMLNPNVGKKIVNVIENQGPSLLTSLFTNLYSTLRVPIRSSTNRTTTTTALSVNKSLSNSSTSSFINSMRRPIK